MKKKTNTKKALGKGIRALLENMGDDINLQTPVSNPQQLAGTVAWVKLDTIQVNPFQPRKQFDEEKLRELTQSIQVHGVVQPVTVRLLENNKLQLISGERRLRASKLAGLKEIPAYIRTANDQEMLEIALIENIQREDLNAIEVSMNYKRLLEECDLTHDALSERLGKNRSTITNYLRLLKLPPKIQLALKDRTISMGHARALLGVEDVAIQLTVFKELLEKRLSVRRVEELVRAYNRPKTKKKGEAKLPYAYLKIEEDLSDHFSVKVALKKKSGGSGFIQIPFSNDEDLHRILEGIELE